MIKHEEKECRKCGCAENSSEKKSRVTSDKQHTVMVLKTIGLNDEQIQEEFSWFFNTLVEKYPDHFGVGLSVLTKGTDSERQVLEIADL